MTNEHIITREMAEGKSTIEVAYDFDEKKLEIQLDSNKRFIKDLLELNLDISIVQILPTDYVHEIYFLDPNTNEINDFKNKKIFIPQYPLGNNLSYSKGEITRIENNEFAHNSTTISGSSGSPLFLEDSTQVIGIHKQGRINKKENYGNFIYIIIKSLQNYKANKIKENVAKNISQNEVIGKYNYSDGTYYIGPLKNGLPNGKGKFILKMEIFYMREI